MKNNKPEKFIERIIVKTVVAFLNAEGGTLIIGVEDDGKVFGLAEDYKLCGTKGRDSFENWLTQTLLKDFGKDAAGLLSTAFHELKSPDPQKPGSGDVCVVSVKPPPKPRFVVEEARKSSSSAPATPPTSSSRQKSSFTIASAGPKALGDRPESLSYPKNPASPICANPC